MLRWPNLPGSLGHDVDEALYLFDCPLPGDWRRSVVPLGGDAHGRLAIALVARDVSEGQERLVSVAPAVIDDVVVLIPVVGFRYLNAIQFQNLLNPSIECCSRKQRLNQLHMVMTVTGKWQWYGWRRGDAVSDSGHLEMAAFVGTRGCGTQVSRGEGARNLWDVGCHLNVQVLQKYAGLLVSITVAGLCEERRELAKSKFRYLS